MVAFTPRSLATKPTASKEQDVASNRLENIKLDDKDKTVNKPMSNAEFRSALLKKN
jgi:hypothetical protein